MTRRCFACGVGHEQGEVVRRCDSCAFDYCNDHAATVGGVTTCEECKEADVSDDAMGDAVREAKERLTVAVCRWMAADRAAKAPPFVHLGQREWSVLWWELNDAYDALLDAERAAKEAPHA